MAGEEAERFAALLRDLKDASGLSYGVLARRLHVSPSTLHRYANADSPPAGFDLAERYARVCGAGPQERLGLHRAWLLADAARHSGRRAPVTEPLDQPPAVTAPAVVQEQPDVPVAVRPDRPPRRRALLTGAAVVAALALGAASAVAVDAWRNPAGTGPAASSSAPVARAQVTVTARAEPYVWNGRCTSRYLIDRPPTEVPAPPPPQRRNAWIRALDGIPLGQQVLKVTVTTDAPGVVLDGLGAQVQALGQVSYRNAYVTEPGCGPAPALPSFFADLDGLSPVVVPSGGQSDFPLLVSGGTPTVFYVRASAEWHRADWVLHLRWSSGDRHGVLTVDDGGAPFRISGPGGVGLFQAIPGGGWFRR